LYKKIYSPEEKIKIVNKVLERHQSISSVALSYSIDFSTLKGWIRNYQSMESEAFYKKGWTKRTSKEKESAVMDYLNGQGSLHDVCKKYKISDTKTLRKWILKYNSHEKLKASGTGGSTIMTRGRKTTFEERVEIVQYCIANNHNYAETSGITYLS